MNSVPAAAADSRSGLSALAVINGWHRMISDMSGTGSALPWRLALLIAGAHKTRTCISGIWARAVINQPGIFGWFKEWTVDHLKRPWRLCNNTHLHLQPLSPPHTHLNTSLASYTTNPWRPYAHASRHHKLGLAVWWNAGYHLQSFRLSVCTYVRACVSSLPSVLDLIPCHHQ